MARVRSGGVCRDGDVSRQAVPCIRETESGGGAVKRTPKAMWLIHTGKKIVGAYPTEKMAQRDCLPTEYVVGPYIFVMPDASRKKTRIQ